MDMFRHIRRRGWTLLGLLALLAIIGAGIAATRRPSLDDWPRLSAASGVEFEVRFYGTSSLAFVEQGEAFVLDGFLTRPSLSKVAFKRLEADKALIEQMFDESGITSVSAVMTAHSHYDHAMDAPSIVRRFGGEVWGSASTMNIARAEGLLQRRLVKAGDHLEAGGLTVRVFGSGHSPGGMAMDDIADGFRVPAKAKDYRYGGGFGLHLTRGHCRMLVIPSSGLPDLGLKDHPADVIFLSIAQLGLQEEGYVRRYYDATVRASGAKLVVPIHWDDFTRPLSQPLRPLPYVVERADKGMASIAALARSDGIEVALPLVGVPLKLPPPCDA